MTKRIINIKVRVELCTMNVYQFSYSVSKTEIEVKDNTNTIIGYISRIEIKECEKNYAFSFQNINNSCVKIGIKKRNAREFFAPKYIILTEQGSDMLQDRAWRNLLYFSVSGSID